MSNPIMHDSPIPQMPEIPAPDGNGAPAPGAKFCPQCGEKLDFGMKFCPGCGTPVAGRTPATQAPSTADDGERREYRREKFPWEMDPHRINEKPGFFSFQGRSLRSEYWRVSGITAVVFLVWFMIFDLMTQYSMRVSGHGEILITALWIAGGLACCIMYGICLPVSVRRCHDLNFSGGLLLLPLIPFVGWLFALGFWVFLGCIAGTHGPNQYGPDPKEFLPSSGPADGKGTRISSPTPDGRCIDSYPSLPCWLAFGGCVGMVLMSVVAERNAFLWQARWERWSSEYWLPGVFVFAGFILLGLAVLSLRNRDRVSGKTAGVMFLLASGLLLLGLWRAFYEDADCAVLGFGGGLLAAGVCLLRHRRGGVAIGWAVAVLAMLWKVVFWIAGMEASFFDRPLFLYWDLSWCETVSIILLCVGFGLLAASALRQENQEVIRK